MGSHAVLGRQLWAGGYDLTGDTNAITLPISFDELDDTRFTAGGTTAGRSRIAGLETATLDAGGFLQTGAGSVDAAIEGMSPAVIQVMTVSAEAAEGSVAYFFQSRRTKIERFTEVGAVMPWKIGAVSTKGNGARGVGAVRGRSLKAKATVSATGATGTAYQLGAVAADEYAYAALHVFSAGTTITAVLESAPDNTFAAATTRITFGPVTAVGSTWGTRVGGPITDTWWRLRITAITGSFDIACAAGIK